MMQTLDAVSYRRLVLALGDDGFRMLRASGTHRLYKHADGRRVVLQHVSADGVPIGALLAVISDAGWQKADLIRLKLFP